MPQAGHTDELPALRPLTAFNSGDTGNGEEVTGQSVDLQGTTGRRYRRARLVVTGQSLLGSEHNIRGAANYQHSNAAATGFVDFGSTAASVIMITTSATGDFTWSPGEVELSGARRYLRAQFTATFQTDTGGGDTDTGRTLGYAGVFVMTDANRLPATG